ncbi:MAG: hypothetical protein JXR27_09920 [Paludibacteraceae bacterium]|nr:hypothetical protein [Paludibacteraceae bacterium]
MLNYFPKYFTSKAITLYLAALMVVSVLFMNMAMSVIWWVFGIVEVAGFFYFSNQLTRKWANYSENTFSKKLFRTGLVLRIVWVFFSYFFYLAMTGEPYEFSAADVKVYQAVGTQLAQFGFEKYESVFWGMGISDRGYGTYLGLLYMVFGNGVIIPRLIKAALGAFAAVLIYRVASRNFGEEAGRMSGIFYMLMPNLIMYTGSHLKEAEMVFLTVAFIERADYIIRSKSYNFINIAVPIVLAGLLFLFRTVLGATALFSLMTAILMSGNKVLNMGKRTVLAVWIGLAMIYLVGGKIATEIEQVWESRGENQKASMEWRATREGGNQFAKYATGAVFAPMIFVIPFPTMVETPGQENQRLINGGNYVKNILAFFTMFALFLLIKEGKWRDHLLIGSFTIGYLVVIALSAFAQSERFHQPALPFILVFAAYGISRADNKTKRHYTIWLAFIFVALIGWSWFKLAGRGLA